MAKTERLFQNSPRGLGVNEIWAYTVDTTPWGGYTSNVTVTLFDSGSEDVSSTNLDGSASVSGDVITTPKVTGLTAGEIYKIVVEWVNNGNTNEAYGHIVGEA